jgi:metal-dependent amidase/aminoacylase/carboxypeptidase family protein
MKGRSRVRRFLAFVCLVGAVAEAGRLDPREFDLTDYFNHHPLYSECLEYGERKQAVRLETVEYHDFDGDGTEEIIVRGYSCFTGTAGADIHAVYRLDSSQKLVELEIDDNGGRFQGQSLYEQLVGNRNFILYANDAGELVEEFHDRSARPDWQSPLALYFSWNGEKFILSRVERDVPRRHADALPQERAGGRADEPVDEPAGPPVVRSYGSLRAIMHEGKVESVTRLDELLPDESLYAVGALSDLRGEITIVAGVPYISYPAGSDQSRIVSAMAVADTESACLLVTAPVAGWISAVVDEEVPFAELDRFIETLATSAGLDASGAFPFLIESMVRDLEWHVIDGSRLPSGESSHAEHRGAAVRHQAAESRALLVGFYSPRDHGVFTHMGSNTHIHCVIEEGTSAGHVDHVLLPAGTVVHLPVTGEQEPIEKRITEEASRIHDESVQIRRDLHQHPELSDMESRTARLVAERLRSYGLEVRTDVGGHGVVGTLRGNGDGPVVAYRADMDALPQEIDELVPFKSTSAGVSHACGHDVHTAIGLGVARVLSSLRGYLPGTVLFLFQPAEETTGGAKRMIAEGVLENPRPEAIFAVHVAPVETGGIITNPGVGLPGMEQLTIRLTGADAVVAAAALVDSIRAIGTVHYPESDEEWARYFGALFQPDSFLSSFVLAMASVDPVISAMAHGDRLIREATVRGSLKASGAGEYERARALIQRTLAGLEAQGITSSMESAKVLPDMFCDEKLATWAAEPLEAVLGRQSVFHAANSFPFFGEDFAYFLQRVPGAMFFLGASNAEKGISALPHSPAFGVDEDTIRVGTVGMSNVIAQYLLESPGGSGETPR